jgi:hypothetical protein
MLTSAADITITEVLDLDDLLRVEGRIHAGDFVEEPHQQSA